MVGLALATEDELSEVVGQKLVSDVGGDLMVTMQLRRGGFGYLRSRMRNFCELARQMPVLLLTDLDAVQCPMTLIRDWSRNDAIPDGLLFRVAVRQIESWLLADRESMANFFKVSLRRLPRNPDELPDAKRLLLELASEAPRKLREELLAVRGATAGQGLGYNALLSDFVRVRWNPASAAMRSDSLSRARLRLAELAAGSS
jgi:hypothetical protein